MNLGGPRRIVCLTEETTETLYLLGEQDRILGISGFTSRPPEARQQKPKVSAFTSANIPKILDLGYHRKTGHQLSLQNRPTNHTGTK